MARTDAPETTRRETLLAAAAAIFTAGLMTWPLLPRAADHVLQAAFYWDAYTNAMIMAGRVDALLGRSPLSLYEDYFFAPLPNSIVFNENLVGLSLVFAPFYLASGNPLWAYNLTLLTSLASSVFFTYLLVRRLTHSGYAGVLAGVAFAFCPYVMFELGRIQLVATQWIPLCLLMLHRVMERRQPLDVALLWLAFLLQVGTCLYYAMFLMPLLALAGVILLFRQPPPRKVLLQLAAGGVLAALLAFAVVHPYFSVRDAFTLERSPEFASRYDGKLGFLLNVPPTNLSLTALRHEGAYRGAHEEIAFPGFVVFGTCLLSLGVSSWAVWRKESLRVVGTALGLWLGLAFVSVLGSLLLQSLLAGALAFALGAVWLHRRGQLSPFSGTRGLYLGVLLLSVALFLGLFPFEWRGEPVRGLYYYLFSYFPGFDGIRKVSRQAVMTTLSFVLLGSFGSAWLLSRLRTQRSKTLVFTALLAGTVYEFRSFPHPVHAEWAAPEVPEVYRFVATLPKEDVVVAVPQHDGVERFRSDAGRALHNYLMALHKHRSLNGQSSYVLPVTDMVERVTTHLPEDATRRVLSALGARHVVVHAADLHPTRRDWPSRLSAQSEHYQLAFRGGEDYVFSLLPTNDPSLEPVHVPTLPAGAELVARDQLRASGVQETRYAHKSLDQDPRTFWPGPALQAKGQWFELELREAREVVALEFENRSQVNELPLSYQVSVGSRNAALRTVFEQPAVRLYHEQIYSPKTFVWRVVLPAPVLAERVRITIDQALPGHGFRVHEARVWAKAR